MKIDKLIDAIGEIDENKITNAKETLARTKKSKYVHWAACVAAVVVLLGVGLWQGDFFDNVPSVELQDSTNIGEKDYIEPETNSQSSDIGDVIGMVKYNGASYVQYSTTTQLYTPDKYLGDASDFEGTYQTYLKDVSGGLYMTKEDPNVFK